MNDCTAIVMAGGQGSRLRRLGRFMSKAALVAYDQPMLMRHLDHLLEAGFRKVIVSTNPLHHPTLDALMTNYAETIRAEGVADADLRLLNNPAHLIGPTEGLRGAVAHITTRRTLIVLVDEFMRGNPYTIYAGHVGGDGEYGGVAALHHARETLRGGYVTVRDGQIISYVERTGIRDAEGLPSTGTLLVTTDALREDMTRFIAAAPTASSIGDFLEYRVAVLGRQVWTVEEPDFVNINTPDYLLLANLYAAMERHGEGSPVHDELARAAAALRAWVHDGY
jgi:NDP-sugar pyrophosphorylase family protein